MKKKIVSSFLSCLILTSCGSINKRDKYVAIQSYPSQQVLKIKRDQFNEFYKTPIILDTFESYENIIMIGDQEYQIRCSLDYKNSIIPNSILGLINPTFGVIGFGYDYFKGRYRSCPEINYFKQENSNNLKLHKLLILPVFNDWKIREEKLVELIQSKVKDSIVVSYSDSLSSFYEYGITKERKIDIKDIQDYKFLRLMKKYNADGFIKVDLEKSKISIYSPYERKITYESTFNINKISETKEIDRVVKKYFYILPNSLSLSHTALSHESSRQEVANLDREILTKEHPASLPDFLSLWGVETIVSPHFYKEFDTDSFFSPSISFSSWRTELYQVNPQREFLGYKNISSTFLTYDYTISAIYKDLSLSIAYGLGLGLFFVEDSSLGDNTFTKTVSHFEFRINYFLSSRYYLFLNTEFYNIESEDEKTRLSFEDEKLSNFTEASFGIGYFFPEVLTWF